MKYQPTIFVVFLKGIFLLFSLSALKGQNLPVQAGKPDARCVGDSAAVAKKLSTSYFSVPLVETTAAVAVVNTEQFNPGLVYDALQLVRGKVAGLQLYPSGKNPNVAGLTRIRGLSAYAQREPLFVVDGFAGASPELLDPNDIAEVIVLKDGSAQALYGIRASNGVVLIKTKAGGHADSTLTVAYSGQLAVSKAYEDNTIMEAGDFRKAGGYDFGASTNWQDQILRQGVSQVYSLSVAGLLPGGNYRLAGNLRKVDGVLDKSGFEQKNIRMHLNTDLGTKKLSLQLSAAYNHRDKIYSFPEALGYAVSYNPTAPVYAEAAPYSFTEEQFGGFFEMIGLFDGYNPKALIELNTNKGEATNFNSVGMLSYRLSRGIQINARYGYEDVFENERIVYSPQALYGGNALLWPSTRRGRAELRDVEKQLSLYELFINYKKEKGQLLFQTTSGFSYTNQRSRTYGLSLSGISTEEQLDSKRIGDYGNWQSANTIIQDSLYSGWNDRSAAVFTQLHLQLDDQYFFDASLRYEGAGKLGTNKQWGIFPALGAAVDFSKYLNTLEQLRLRVGWGMTGAIPDRAGLAKEQLRMVVIPDSITYSEVIQRANPDLEWEKKQTFNLGVDLKKGIVTTSVNWYHHRVSDWIMESHTDYSRRMFVNQNALTSTGLELTIKAELIASSALTYLSGLVFSTSTTRYSKIEGDQITFSTPCCIGAEPLIAAKEGEAVGSLYGPRFSGEVDSFGDQIYEDINGDGQLITNPGSLFADESDLTLLGNGLPTVELGWWHTFMYKRWELNAFFRSILGHSLVNRARQRWEPEYSGRRIYNYVDSDLAVDGLQTSRYSSLYVEKADFLKLDYLSLRYGFCNKKNKKETVEVVLTVENILIASAYSGTNPEPVIEDYGPLTGGAVRQLQSEPLSAGIDRLGRYPDAVTVSLGVGLVF